MHTANTTMHPPFDFLENDFHYGIHITCYRFWVLGSRLRCPEPVEGSVVSCRVSFRADPERSRRVGCELSVVIQSGALSARLNGTGR